MLRRGIAMSKFMHILKVVNRFCNTALQKGFTNLSSYEQCRRLSVFLATSIMKKFETFASLIDKNVIFLLLLVGMNMLFIGHLHFFFHELLTFVFRSLFYWTVVVP